MMQMRHKLELLSFLDLSRYLSGDSSVRTDLAEIKYLIEAKKIDIRSFLNFKRGELNQTFLHYNACSCEEKDGEEKCQYLVKYGAEVNSIDKFGRTPLHSAVNACKIKITKLLLNNGAYVNAQDETKNTPLHYASTQSVGICDLLLKHGADPNIKNIFYETPIFRAVHGVNHALSHCKEIVKLLLHHGGDVEIRNINQKNAIEVASTLGSEDISDWCKQNVQNSSGKTLILILFHTEI